MKYEGDLYGKVGNKYIKLEQTTKDYAELEEKLAVAERELKTSIGYLITGKRLFAGHTTNSLVDDFIQRYEAKAELKKGGEE